MVKAPGDTTLLACKPHPWAPRAQTEGAHFSARVDTVYPPPAVSSADLRPIDIVREWRPTVSLAGPVALGQVGIMSMALVDTAMVGGLGRTAVGAVGVGGSLYSVALLMGIGLLLGLDRVVSVAHGEGDTTTATLASTQGVWLAVLVGLPLTALLYTGDSVFELMAIDPSLRTAARDYLGVLALSLVPALVFTAQRQSLQAVGDTRFATGILLAANAVNALANYALIYGHLGAPALGIRGAAWATVTSRFFMLIALAWWASRKGLGPGTHTWKPHFDTLATLTRLGAPSAIQLVFESGVFSLSTLLAARISTTAAAAHQVVLQIASFTFMVPLGISSAGAVRVGFAMGRKNPFAARLAGWSAVTLAVTFMALSALTLVTFSSPILSLFHLDPEVTRLAHTLLYCAAFFQLFDGAQVSLAGVLRGLGDTVSSMVANIAAHWGLGLPLGYALAFGFSLGAVGLWLGLAAGLFVVSVSLGLVWARRANSVVKLTPRSP